MEGLHTLVSATLTHNQIMGIFFWVPAKLTDNCPLIANEPFVVYLVINCVTVCNNTVLKFFACGLAVDTISQMCCRGEDAV